jgi:hypothetical protein
MRAPSGTLPAQVAAVVANRGDAYGLQRAAAAGAPTLVLERQPGQDRRAYDTALAEAVAAYAPDWVVLAGWMRILTMAFLGRFPGRVINLHPALPGAFPGVHAIERAFAAYARGRSTAPASWCIWCRMKAWTTGRCSPAQKWRSHPANHWRSFQRACIRWSTGCWWTRCGGW